MIQVLFWVNKILHLWQNKLTFIEKCRGKKKSIFTKTRLYNFYHLKSHLYIVKLGFTGIYIIFLIWLKNIDRWLSLEPPRRAALTSTHNLCFKQKYENCQIVSSENFLFFLVVSRKHAYIILTPLNHFHIVKLGFTGVYIIFPISAQKHRLWVLVRTASPRRF